MSFIKKLTRVHLLMLILSLTIKELKAQADGAADGAADGPTDGAFKEDKSESVEKANDVDEKANDVDEKANDVEEEDDTPKDLNILEKEEGKESLEVFFRRKADPELKMNSMLYNDAAAMEAPPSEDLSGSLDYSSIRLTLYPFAVSIQNKGLHYATASLLSYKWLISAAADFYNVRESIRMLRARLGSIDCKRGGITKRIREIFIHPQFKPNIPNYDLAMLKLASAVTYGEDIKPIPMSPIDDGHDLEGSFLSTYWARLLKNGTPVNETAGERVREGRLRVSKKRILPFTECYDTLSRYNATMENTTVCHHPFMSYHSPCMPDSGAPMVVNNELWGVTSSYTPADCSADDIAPTYATRLTAPSIRNWITETLTLE